MRDTAVKSVELGTARAWLVWVLAVAFVVLYFSFQTGYAIVNPSVQKDIGLTVAQVAIVAAVYTWVFALCQFFSGALLDRVGAGRIIPISIALVTIGIFLFTNAESYTSLLLSQLIIAVGACSQVAGFLLDVTLVEARGAERRCCAHHIVGFDAGQDIAHRWLSIADIRADSTFPLVSRRSARAASLPGSP